MTLIHTCQLCVANSFDYLIELQRHARELAASISFPFYSSTICFSSESCNANSRLMRLSSKVNTS
jgi:hypothetical protein